MAVSAGLPYKVLSKYHKELEDEYVAKSWRLGVSEGRPNKGWRLGSGKRDGPPQVYSEVCPLGSVVKKGETERTWGRGDAKWGREAYASTVWSLRTSHRQGN